MKFLTALVAVAALVLASCSKNESPDPNPPSPDLRITAVNPGHAPRGATIIISGNNFHTTPSFNRVWFEGSLANANVLNASATQLSVVVPADAITGKITINVQNRSAVSPADFIVDQSASAITDFNPSQGPVGTTVTITGTGFANNSQVSINGSVATVTANSATEIVFTVPTGVVPGAYKINVVTGNSNLQTTGDFTVTAPAATAQWIAKNVNAAPAAIFNAGTSFVYKNKIYWGFTKISFNQAQADYMILDPAGTTLQWVLGNTPPVDMIPSTMQHATAVVHNDKVYIGTGLTPTASNSWWEYHPETNTATRLTNHPVATSGAVSFVLNNNIYAGFGGTNKNLYQFDPAGTGAWTEKLTANVRELSAASAFVIGNDAYIGRALITAGGSRTHFFKYSGGNTLTAIAGLPEEIQSPRTPSFVVGDRGYFVTGNKVWEYVPATNTWTAVLSGPGVPVIRYTAQVTLGGTLTTLGWTDRGELFEFRKNP